jgi:hypothetical protein
MLNDANLIYFAFQNQGNNIWAMLTKPDAHLWEEEHTAGIVLALQDVVPAPHTPPRPVDCRRVNLYRIEKLPVPAPLTWSPTRKDFHVPAMFGEMVCTDRRAS